MCQTHICIHTANRHLITQARKSLTQLGLIHTYGEITQKHLNVESKQDFVWFPILNGNVDAADL